MIKLFTSCVIAFTGTHLVRYNCGLVVHSGLSQSVVNAGPKVVTLSDQS